MKVAHHCFELRKVTSYLLYGLSFVGYLQENPPCYNNDTFNPFLFFQSQFKFDEYHLLLSSKF